MRMWKIKLSRSAGLSWPTPNSREGEGEDLKNMFCLHILVTFFKCFKKPHSFEVIDFTMLKL